ncbi:hypothetical protein QP028_11130 [Corynebacterium suedekumii]|nr:hypothetical protein QP028_11130 [Corynebacterium suedekumii]
MSSVAALGPHTTVAELVTLYIASTAKRSRPTTPQTRELYTRVTDTHLPTGLGGGIATIQLGNCDGQAIRAWLEDKHATVPSTAKTLRSVLLGAFKWAEGRGVKFWDRNPATGADIAVPAPEVKAMTHADVEGTTAAGEGMDGRHETHPRHRHSRHARSHRRPYR